MKRDRHGMTLVELTAALTALAVLVAVLAPALGGVRHRGKETVCLQNLARIAQASILYAAHDQTEAAIPVHPQQFSLDVVQEHMATRVGAYLWGGKSGRGPEQGLDARWWGTKKRKGPATRPLNQILYGDVFPDYRTNPGPGQQNWDNDENLDLSVYRCPSDNGYMGGPHYSSFKNSKLTSYDHYGNSYGANLVWIYLVGSSPCYLQSNSPYMHRLSEVISPSQTVYYLENCGRFAWLEAPQPAGCEDDLPGDVVHGWHGRAWTFNTAFVDGHAEPVEIRGSLSPHLGRYPNCPPWCYSVWRCVITRGDGWQFDTLPAPPTVTYLPCSQGSGAVDEEDPGEGLRLVPPEW